MPFNIFVQLYQKHMTWKGYSLKLEDRLNAFSNELKCGAADLRNIILRMNVRSVMERVDGYVRDVIDFGGKSFYGGKSEGCSAERMQNISAKGETILYGLSWNECTLIEVVAIEKLRQLARDRVIGACWNVGDGFDGNSTTDTYLAAVVKDRDVVDNHEFYLCHRMEAAEAVPLMQGYLYRYKGTVRGDPDRKKDGVRVLEYKKVMVKSTRWNLYAERLFAVVVKCEEKGCTSEFKKKFALDLHIATDHSIFELLCARCGRTVFYNVFARHSGSSNNFIADNRKRQ